jgi:outer membrane protein assembly factor BamB
MAASFRNTGVIYVADSTNFNAIGADGTVKWRIPMLWAGPAAVAQDGTIYVGAAGRGRPTDSLYSFDSNGGLRWEFPVDGSANYSPLGPPGPTIGADGTVYVVAQGMQGNHEGVVYAIGEKNGGLMKDGWPKFRGTMSNDGRASFP